MTPAQLTVVRRVIGSLPPGEEREALCALVDHAVALERSVVTARLLAEQLTRASGRVPLAILTE